MKLWMYGTGEEPEKGAALLKDIGFSAVVGGPSSVEAALTQGMEAWLCTGTYHGPSFKGTEWLARDVKQEPRDWFGSTCPNRKEVREYNLESVRKMASTPGIKGVIIDGCRFASPASGSVNEAFFTCFCPECQKKAREMGFDPDKMLRSADGLYDFVHGKDVDLLPLCEGLEDWMEFRRASTTEHLLDFVNAVHGSGNSLEPPKAGIYIFTPSLAKMVGQSYRDLNGKMDLIAPMIYRCYQDPRGAACLNAELAVILEILEGASSLTARERIRWLRALTGLGSDEGLSEEAGKESILRGLPVDVLRTETHRAAVMTPDSSLIPIIQLDDPDVESAVKQTMAGGAEAVDFFIYQESWVLEREASLRKLAAL